MTMRDDTLFFNYLRMPYRTYEELEEFPDLLPLLFVVIVWVLGVPKKGSVSHKFYNSLFVVVHLDITQHKNRAILQTEPHSFSLRL